MGVFKKLSCAAAAMTFGLSMFAASANAAPNPNFHIYIAYGQSNMAGNGAIVPAEDQAVPPKNFFMLASHTASASDRKGSTTQSIKKGEWAAAIPPMFHSFEQLSPADYFGRAMVEAMPGVVVGIIPVAIGGVAIKAYLPDQYQAYFNGPGASFKGWANDYGGNPMGRILELGKKAKEVGVIKGIIFHQGETDGSGPEWQENVYKSYRVIIDELGLDENEVPFVAGEMMNDPTGNSGKGSCCYSKNGGIAELSKKFKKFGVASSSGLKGNGADPYHFGREGVIELGKRYASEMLKLIDTTIDPDAPALDLQTSDNSSVVDEKPEEYGPYYELPIAIPGLVQAEEYNRGGSGKAYKDNNIGNEGGKFRKDNVDIYQPNMGVVVGYCEAGEWLKYTVNVEADGEYEISANVAGDNGSGSFVLYVDDKQIGTEMVNMGKGFDVYDEVSGGTAVLTAGEHELKLEITNSWIDIDWVKFTKIGGTTDTTAKDTVAKDSIPESIRASLVSRSMNMDNAQYFDMRGHRVSKATAQKQGVYLVRVPGVKTFVVRNEK